MENTNPVPDQIIRRSAYFAMGAGIIPIPIGDLIAVAAVQLDMLKQLSNHFVQDYSEMRGKAFIAALNGSILARIGASMFKTIPVVGPLLGGISMAALSGASTFAIGHVFVYYMTEYGSIDDVNMKEAKEKYDDAFEEAKSMVSNSEEQDQGDVYAKLDKLGELLKKGIITRKEFDEKKKKLLEEM